MAKIGEIVDEKYEILSLIGEGGMSRVWLARDLHLNKLWAIKEIKRQGLTANNDIIFQSLITEANLMKKLDHPALPRIVDIQQNETTIYVIMDYIEGEPLSAVLKRMGPLPEASVIDCGIQLCDALSYLHTRKPPVIYRDMKPSNVMLREDGTVKLIDFGIAREYKNDQSHDTQVLGTRNYAPPEQYDADRQTDARSDIYALGATLYRLITGQLPEAFQTRSIREINPDLSEGLDYIISRATRIDPNERYQSCVEMCYDLEHYEQLTQEYRSGQITKLKKFRRIIAAAVVCAVIGVACLCISNYLITSTYENLVQHAGVASRDSIDDGSSEAERYYMQAIETDPERIDTYELLIELYREDHIFTVGESERFQQMWSKYQDNIVGHKGFALLCYEVARLYFGSYDYGGETGQRSAALKWYAYAEQYYDDSADMSDMPAKKIVKAYEIICQFYTPDAEEDEELYGKYWNSLKEVYEGFSDEADTATQLHLYLLIVNAIADPAVLNGFSRVAGVTQDEATEFLDDIYNSAKYLQENNIIGKGGKNETMYAEIISSYPIAQASLEAEYKSVVHKNESYEESKANNKASGRDVE